MLEQDAPKLNWREEATKICIFITDSPPIDRMNVPICFAKTRMISTTIGLHDALKLSWREEATKTCIFITEFTLGTTIMY